MGDATQATVLTLQDVLQIISAAKAGGANAVQIGIQIFSSLGDNASVSGDTLRTALAASSVPVRGPLAPALAAIQTVVKNQDHVMITNNGQVELMLGDTRARIKEQVDFEVAVTASLPVLDNIQGLQAHKMIWISIQRIELIQNQGRNAVRVTAAGITREIPIG